jgi:hypothetical protein
MNMISKLRLKFTSGNTVPVERATITAAEFDELQAEWIKRAGIDDIDRDAARYRYLRDENNWGEDSGHDSWAVLGESNGEAFDSVVDSRMNKSDDADA